MRIASEMGGFSLGEADLLRKAMGKKQKDIMSEQKKRFLDGARAKGIKPAIAEKVFSQMEKFAEYGFNKSHSAAYAVLSTRTAYLKAHYPAEFMAATLTSEMDNTDRVTILMDDCRDLGIEVVAPNVNSGEADFRARDGRIYYGLGAVKNVGVSAVERLVEERATNGTFRSLENLASRLTTRLINRRVYESLICAGALDSLPGHRAQKFGALDMVLERAARRARDAERGQFGLFGESSGEPEDAPMPEIEAWPAQEQLQKEKEALGLFLSGHPLDRFKDLIMMIRTTSSKELLDMAANERAVIGGLITAVKLTMDRNQRQMAFVTIEDPEGQAEVVMFSDVLEKSRRFVAENNVVVVEGRVSRRAGGEGKVLVNTLLSVGEPGPAWKEVHVTLDLDATPETTIDEMKKVLFAHTGDSRVFFHVREQGKSAYVIRARSQGVRVDTALVSGLSASIGARNVRLIPAGLGADPPPRPTRPQYPRNN